MTEKRKTHTSTAVKRKYNEKTYDKISFSAPKELTANFKRKCAEVGISQAQVFKEAMQSFIEK